ncbi:MAG TPA: alkaline phosphatase family protein [Longimicrobiales bacterium]|nr:alkaline phosphatase family protein [Longimicrobiales bacterium]
MPARSINLFLAALVAILPARAMIARSQAASEVQPAVQLAVLVTIDGLGQDLLERYARLYTGGLRRLIEEGRWYTNACVDHAVTVSHPGHVTLSTGLDPARHGIVDAAFYESTADGGRRFVDAVRDSTEHILGVSGSPGVSPRRIRASGLWDWSRERSPDARRVAVATGRYASLLYARTSGDVYWFSPFAPGYVTSSFYRDAYPDWIERFNREELPRFMADTVWTLSVPEAARRLARRDDTPYESGGRHPTFPHRFHAEVSAEHRGNPVAQANWLANTPAVDGATLALAEQAILARELGQRAVTDLLVVVLSQVDDIGHWYDPRSLEQLDNMLRLDAALGRFFAFLDEHVGSGRWVLAFSSDHGMPAAPEHRQANGESAVRVAAAEVERALIAAERAAGSGERQRGDPPPSGTAARAQRVAQVLEAFDWVADAMTPAELLGREPADSFVTLYRRSYSPDRVPRYPLFSFESGRSDPVAGIGVAVRLRRDVMLDLDISVHGSPYEYDRRVPIILLGAGVRPGRSNVRATTRDVAPTLAALARFPVPPDRDGRALPAPRRQLP